MCSSAYYKESSNELEIQILVCYNVSFYLFNEASFEFVASAGAGKNNVKIDQSSIQLSQNCNIVLVEKKVSL